MEQVRSYALQQEGYVLLPVQFERAYCNVINYVCELSHFGADEADLKTADLVALLSATNCSLDTWLKRAFRKKTEDGDKTPLADVLISSWMDKRGAVETLVDVAKTLLASLNKPEIARSDWGTCVKRDLTGEEGIGFESSFVVLPSLGYPRETVAPGFLSLFPRVEQSFKLAHSSSVRVEAVAATLMRLDVSRMAFSIFQAPDVINGIERKDPMFGPASVVKYILTRIWEFCWLYRVNAQLLLRAPHERLRQAARALHKRVRPLDRDVVELDSDAESVLASIPRHSLVSYFESVWKTGEIEVEYGTHEAIYVHYKYDLTSETADPCGDGPSPLVELYADHLLRLTAATGGNIPCSARGLGVVPAGIRDARAFDEEYVETTDQATALRSERDIIAHWKGLASTLGWTSLSGSIDTIMANGCDFAITDGVRSSRSLDASLLGLVPTFQIGNIKSRGIAMRPAIDEFNVAPTPETIFALPERGVVDATSGGIHFERIAIPMSMNMGEPDLKASNSLIQGFSAFARALSAYYESKSTKYLTAYYRDSESHGSVAQTYWDVQGFKTGSRADLLTDWHIAISKEAVPTASVLYSIRQNGTAFYGRAAVFQSRGDWFIALDRAGAHPTRVAFKRDMIYNNKLESQLSQDFADLDKLLALTPYGRGEMGTPLDLAAAAKSLADEEKGLT